MNLTPGATIVILNSLHRLIAGFSLLLFSVCLSLPGHASTSVTVSQARALIYSSTAAELQWSRDRGQRIQLSYNDQVVGLLDANSYFAGTLDPAVNHRFEIRSLSSANELSAPTLLTFSTRDFVPPVRMVLADSAADVATPVATPVATQDLSQPVLANVSARLYSQSAIELFWTRTKSVLTEIIHNGESLGRFDASSFYKDGLNPASSHRFQINAVDSNGVTLESHTLRLNTAAHSGSVETVFAEAAVETPPVVNPTPTEEPAPAPAPAPVPAPIMEPVPANDAPAQEAVVSAIRNGDCVVRSLSDLSGCVDAAQSFERINIRSNLACSQTTCCPTGGALLRFDNTQSLTIEGNGFLLRREGAQRQCSLLDITQSRSLTVRNWRLDDDEQAPPCLVTDRCPRMLHIRNSRDVLLEQVSVSNSKGYAIYVQQVDGFGFINSRLQNSGVLGLYVGHSGKTSTNIRIQNSAFLDNQTNGLALLGVHGSSTSTNIISGNLFERNHWRGQWPVAPSYGTGFTGGGQMYIAEASGLTVRGNTISDGYCENCFIQQTLGTGVSGIELAVPRSNKVSTVLISDNLIDNHDAWGIFTNQGSQLDNSVVITGNRLLNNTIGLKVVGASVSGNTVQNR